MYGPLEALRVCSAWCRMGGMEDRAVFLKNTELFSTAPDSVLKGIAAMLNPVDFAAGAVIFHEGDPGDALYIVESGTVTIKREGGPPITRQLGECIGEMALLDRAPRSSTVVADSDVRLLRLAEEDFRKILEESKEVALGVFRVLTGKLRQEAMAPITLGVDQSQTQAQPGGPYANPSHELAAGQLFAGRYRMEQRLGQGGMATVYKAVDQILNIPVAIKIMNRISEDERTLGRFKREVILARKVIHPNACRIYDMGEVNGVYYVSMEYVEGKTLTEIGATSKRSTLSEGIPIFRQVLSALEEIHRAGIIHRDLKPQNIMVDRHNRAIIMDFGIAISVEMEQRMTLEGQLVGTPHYMAPEQFGGDFIDHRVDLYAMGVMLFEVFTGKRPFEGTSTMAVITAHLNKPPGKPTAIAPEIPPSLEAIILKALEKDPANRFQSASEMLAALDTI